MDELYILQEPTDISVELVTHDIIALTRSDPVTIRLPQSDIYVVLER